MRWWGGGGITGCGSIGLMAPGGGPSEGGNTCWKTGWGPVGGGSIPTGRTSVDTRADQQQWLAYCTKLQPLPSSLQLL